QAEAFTASLAARLQRGMAIFIDYGFPEAEYYHPQRIGGTLMCHRGHRADADPLVEVGAKDITAHVDFTGIAVAAQDAGLDVAGYASQASFLIDCGIGGLIDAAGVRERVEAQRLLNEHEMGELFKVIAFTRDMSLSPLGFMNGDRRHRLRTPASSSSPVALRARSRTLRDASATRRDASSHDPLARHRLFRPDRLQRDRPMAREARSRPASRRPALSLRRTRLVHPAGQQRVDRPDRPGDRPFPVSQGSAGPSPAGGDPAARGRSASMRASWIARPIAGPAAPRAIAAAATAVASTASTRRSASSRRSRCG